MTRFDLPASVKTFLAAAVRLNVADTLDVFALGAKHQGDWSAMRDEVMEWAFLMRNQDLHAEMCKLNDACCVAGV